MTARLQAAGSRQQVGSTARDAQPSRALDPALAVLAAEEPYQSPGPGLASLKSPTLTTKMHKTQNALIATQESGRTDIRSPRTSFTLSFFTRYLLRAIRLFTICGQLPVI